MRSNLTVCGVFSLLLVSTASAQEFKQELKVVENPAPVLVVDKSGNASMTLTLQNITAGNIPLQLGIDSFTYTRPDGGMYDVPVTATFTNAPQSLDAGKAAQVRITLSGLSDTGESKGILRNGGKNVQELRALHTPAAYNIQVDGSNEALFAPDSQPSITIKNGDPMAYRFEWTLEIGGRSWPGADPVDIAASGTAEIPLSRVKVPAGLISAGTLKDQVTSGTLVLTPILPAGTALQAPVRLPLSVRVRYWGAAGQAIWNLFWTALFLGIGGWASLIFRYFIPNALGAIRFRRQLWGMEQRLDGTGSTLASQYRVYLDAKFADCRTRLRDIPMVFPAFATRLSEIQTAATMYNQWLEIAYGVATLLAEAERILQSGMPPTVMKLIERQCHDALEPIVTGFTKPEELQAMQNALNTAAGYVKALRTGASIPDLEAKIKDREAAVQPNLAILTQAFPTFAGLLNQVANNAGKALSADDYVNRDTLSLQAALLCEYHDLAICAGASSFPLATAVGAPPPAQPPPPPPPALGRMIALHQMLLGYVAPQSYESLRIANLLLDEMKQDFYPAALLAEVGKPQPALQICADPQSIRPGAPIHFSLRFLRRALNDTAAVREWTCDWNFGSAANEMGWDVYHCFDKPGAYTVTVSLQDLNGNPIGTAPLITHQLTAADSNSQRKAPWWLRLWRKFTPEAKVEAMQLAFILVLALSGLYATARGKVETMNGPSAVLALIALGFAADTLKNLVTQKPGQQ